MLERLQYEELPTEVLESFRFMYKSIERVPLKNKIIYGVSVAVQTVVYIAVVMLWFSPYIRTVDKNYIVILGVLSVALFFTLIKCNDLMYDLLGIGRSLEDAYSFTYMLSRDGITQVMQELSGTAIVNVYVPCITSLAGPNIVAAFLNETFNSPHDVYIQILTPNEERAPKIYNIVHPLLAGNLQLIVNPTTKAIEAKRL